MLMLVDNNHCGVKYAPRPLALAEAERLRWHPATLGVLPQKIAGVIASKRHDAQLIKA